MSIEAQVHNVFHEHMNLDRDRITNASSIAEDLGADSLDEIELIMAFEEEFHIEIPDDEARRIITVGDAVRYIERQSR